MNNILTDKEIETLLISLGRGQETFTEQDALDIVKWAERIRTENAVLDAVLENSFCLSVTDGEVYIQSK